MSIVEAGQDLLVFELAGEKYALQAGDVRELTCAMAVTALPDAPSVARGVIDVRGDLIPVLDTRRILGHPSKPVELSDHLVLATVRDDYVVALLVDRVRALVDVGEADVQQLEEVVSPAAIGWSEWPGSRTAFC